MDTRDRIAKLMAMATQDVSPEERDVARAKLAAMGQWPPPAPADPPSPNDFFKSFFGGNEPGFGYWTSTHFREGVTITNSGFGPFTTFTRRRPQE